MSVIGHDVVRRYLEAGLPPVTLLRGPSSVGKRTLTQHLADHHRVAKVDQFTVNDKLTVDLARAAVAFAGIAPFGVFKLLTLNLDGATSPAFGALLKTLEEPPATARFLLVTSAPTLPGPLVSRCRVFTLGLLPAAELRTVLIHLGMTPAAATRAAGLGRGRVVAALESGKLDWHRETVVSLMKAVATRDPVLFDDALGSCDEQTRDLVFRWVVEATTRQWNVFEESEMFGLHRHRGVLRKILLRLSAMPDAQTRLGLRVALEPFFAT